MGKAAGKRGTKGGRRIYICEKEACLLAYLAVVRSSKQQVAGARMMHSLVST